MTIFSEYVNLTVSWIMALQLVLSAIATMCLYHHTLIVEGGGRVLVVANDERTCYQLREVCLSTYNNTMLHCYLAVVIIAIHVQYLCKGGMKLLQRQFERLLASKQLRRPPEGAFFLHFMYPPIQYFLQYWKYIVLYTSIGTSFLFVRCICFPNWRSTSEPLHYTLLSVKGLLKQSWLFLLTIKQFKGKKRALASGKRTERNAAKKRRCEKQSSISFSLEVEDKGERYHFVLSCCERRCRQWYFFDVLHVSRCWLPHFPIALRRSQRTWIWTNQMKKTSYM